MNTFRNITKNPKYSEYCFDINNYEAQVIDLEIPINKTFFNYGILSIENKLSEFDIMTDNIVGYIYFNDPAYEQYKGEYWTQIVLREDWKGGENKEVIAYPAYLQKKEFAEEKINYKTEVNLDKFVKGVTFRAKADYFSGLGELQFILEDIFSATKFASRMTSEKPVDLGEKIRCKFQYRVINGMPQLGLRINECVIADKAKLITIANKYSVPAGLCRDLEKCFPKGSISYKKENDNNAILWNEPTDWIDINCLTANPHCSVQNAVYMCRYIDNNKVQHLSVGYVRDFLLCEKLKEIKNGWFRYSELKDADIFSPEMVLKHVAAHTYSQFELFNDCLLYNQNDAYVLHLENIETQVATHPLTEEDIDISAILNKYQQADIDGEFVTEIKKRMALSHVCIKKNDNCKEEKSWFEKATQWSTKKDVSSAKNVYFAIYTWLGHHKENVNKKYLYIGIVGVDREGGKNNNSVYKRIFEQEQKLDSGIAKINNVVIDKYRYIRINEDNFDNKKARSEIIQTLEMQSINNMSSLFNYNNTSLSYKKELTIKAAFDGIIMNNERYSLEMLNRDKRYHNSFAKGEKSAQDAIT